MPVETVGQATIDNHGHPKGEDFVHVKIGVNMEIQRYHDTLQKIGENLNADLSHKPSLWIFKALRSCCSALWSVLVSTAVPSAAKTVRVFSSSCTRSTV